MKQFKIKDFDSYERAIEFSNLYYIISGDNMILHSRYEHVCFIKEGDKWNAIVLDLQSNTTQTYELSNIGVNQVERIRIVSRVFGSKAHLSYLNNPHRISDKQITFTECDGEIVVPEGCYYLKNGKMFIPQHLDPRSNRTDAKISAESVVEMWDDVDLALRLIDSTNNNVSAEPTRIIPPHRHVIFDDVLRSETIADSFQSLNIAEQLAVGSFSRTALSRSVESDYYLNDAMIQTLITP